MLDALELDPATFMGTSRLMLDEARERSWKVYVLQEGSSRLFIDRGDGKLQHLYGSMLPSLGFNAATVSNNKQLTTEFLRMAGIPQLASSLVDVTEEFDTAQQLLEAHKKVVVKPYDGAHGDGIRMNISTLESLREAAQHALTFSNGKRKVIVQQQFQSDTVYDIRLLCIDYEFVAAIHRIPARVLGDGTSSILELIERENTSADRGVPYKTRFALIDTDRAKRYLGSDIARVPLDGEDVRVIDVANYGAGGELVDITESIPSWMKDDAERAARAIELPVAGVDYLLSGLPSLSLNQNDVEAFIIEINKSPSLAIHDEPHVGENRKTVAKVLDLLDRS